MIYSGIIISSTSVRLYMHTVNKTVCKHIDVAAKIGQGKAKSSTL